MDPRLHLLTSDSKLAEAVRRICAGWSELYVHDPKVDHIHGFVALFDPHAILVDSRLDVKAHAELLAAANPNATIIIVGQQLNGVPTIDPEHIPLPAWKRLILEAVARAKESLPPLDAFPAEHGESGICPQARAFTDLSYLLNPGLGGEELDRELLRFFHGLAQPEKSVLLGLAEQDHLRILQAKGWPEQPLSFPEGSSVWKSLVRINRVISIQSRNPNEDERRAQRLLAFVDSSWLVPLQGPRWVILGRRSIGPYAPGDHALLTSIRDLVDAILLARSECARTFENCQDLSHAFDQLGIAVYRIGDGSSLDRLGGTTHEDISPLLGIAGGAQACSLSLAKGAYVATPSIRPPHRRLLILAPAPNAASLSATLLLGASERFRNSLAALQMMFCQLPSSPPDLAKIVADELRGLGALIEDIEDVNRSILDHQGTMNLMDAVTAAANRFKDARVRPQVMTNPENGGDFSIEGSPSLITGCLGRIVENAVDAARTAVKIEVTHDAREIQVMVRDDGDGFSEAALHRAFDPFFTERPGKAGLGLTAARQIARLHSGVIEIRPAPGGCVAVRFPSTAHASSPFHPKSRSCTPRR
jgi:hypothetical protein